MVTPFRGSLFGADSKTKVGLQRRILLALALASLTFLATMLLTRHPLAAELGRLAPWRRARPAP